MFAKIRGFGFFTPYYEVFALKVSLDHMILCLIYEAYAISMRTITASVYSSPGIMYQTVSGSVPTV